MLGKIESGRRRGRQRMGCLNGITDSVDMSFIEFQESVLDNIEFQESVLEAWHAAVHVVTKSWTQLSDWTDWLCVCEWISMFLKRIIYFLSKSKTSYYPIHILIFMSGICFKKISRVKWRELSTGQMKSDCPSVWKVEQPTRVSASSLTFVFLA